MKQTLFLFFGAAALAACADLQPAAKRDAECYVRYLKPESQLLAEISFRETPSGKSESRPWNPPGGVRYGGSLMRELTLQDVPMYRLETGGGYSATHTFTWADESGHKDTLGMELPAIAAFTFSDTALSRRKPSSFTWTGAPLEKGEALVLMWERTSDRKTVPMEIVGTPGQQAIDFPAAQLAKLEPGTWTLYVVRRKIVETGTKGGGLQRCTAEYYSDVDTLRVTD